jgi:hypothetical protein
MKAVSSGLKKTVGGTVMESARFLNAVDPIQYKGIIMITSTASTRTTARRFHKRCILD